MGLTSATKWWEEWQLRILVLGSQFIQFILLLAQFLRRTRYRSFIWLAYICGDAVAIYALTTLFSRLKLEETDEGDKVSSIEVVWVPVLLIHLGGQYTISAYSLEDNELWRRHVVTLVIKVAVAIYTFNKWWFGDVKLLVAAILLFILGIIKFAEKPWALRKASFDNVQASSSLSQRRKQGAVAAWWAWCTSIPVEYAKAMRNRREGEECESLEEYVQEASMIVQEEIEKATARLAMQGIEGGLYEDRNINYLASVDVQDTEAEAADNQEEESDDENQEEGSDDESWPAISHTNYLVDVIVPYSVRLRDLQSFMKLNRPQQIIAVKCYIAAKSSLMYTNVRTVASPLGHFFHLILFPCLAMVSVVLFGFSSKDGYNMKDIRVTYIVFSCTTLLEFYAYLVTMQGMKFRRSPEAYITSKGGRVSQYSLLSYHARKKKPTFLMKLAIFNCLRELVNRTWYISQEPSGGPISGRVFRHVVYGWNTYIEGDAARYKRFNDLRGQLFLGIHRQMENIGWSVDTRFDESVILWHIATDLCFHHPNSPQSTQPNQPNGAAGAQAQLTEQNKQLSRAISNYMIYLLLNQPEMLIPGARSALFYIASDGIESLLRNRSDADAALDGEESIELLSGNSDVAALDGEESIARAMIQATGTEDTTLVPRARRLAEELMKLHDENKRWNLIQGVWTEMFCYSISRRRGYLQAKYMAEHADCLNYVWVLWAFMGMETCVERHHRFEHEHPEEDEAEGEEEQEEYEDGNENIVRAG